MLTIIFHHLQFSQNTSSKFHKVVQKQYSAEVRSIYSLTYKIRRVEGRADQQSRQ